MIKRCEAARGKEPISVACVSIKTTNLVLGDQERRRKRKDVYARQPLGRR
jgi:hypothetical protein